MSINEKYANRPNLLRVAKELATYEEPDRVAEALVAMISAVIPKKPLPKPEGEQSNNEKFNTLLNSCENPRAVYNAMTALAPMIKEMRKGHEKS